MFSVMQKKTSTTEKTHRDGSVRNVFGLNALKGHLPKVLELCSLLLLLLLTNGVIINKRSYFLD